MGLELTGERTLPGIWHENYWFQRHVAAYRYAAARCAGLRVLDAGCGEGYGAALLAETATGVVGVDVEAAVVTHARPTYPQVTFVAADLAALPLPDGSFDAVVSLQVVEHLPDVERYRDEMARVLRPGGRFYCTTPNRLTFTPGSDVPLNPFHVTEFTASELAAVLAERFDVELLGLHHAARLAGVERSAGHALPQRLLDEPPQRWPAQLRELVAGVTPEDFEVRAAGVDASLDLLAVGTRS